MYTMNCCKFREVYDDIVPAMYTHYQEMKERLESEGYKVSECNPDLKTYLKYGDEGWLLSYTLRLDDIFIGYANVYITEDMHNGDLIAQEDALFVYKNYRNGVGKQFVKYILNDLNSRGIKRLIVSAMTDLRVEKVWRRMGFTDLAKQMQYTFDN